MGTVFNRGTKGNPNWCVGYRENGRWVYKASRQPTKALAKRWVSVIDLSGGASLDQVSAAVGHSSLVVTKRFYDHYVRRSFSPKLRAGLGLGAQQ